jgi:hypothetical protein
MQYTHIIKIVKPAVLTGAWYEDWAGDDATFMAFVQNKRGDFQIKPTAYMLQTLNNQHVRADFLIPKACVKVAEILNAAKEAIAKEAKAEEKPIDPTIRVKVSGGFMGKNRFSHTFVVAKDIAKAELGIFIPGEPWLEGKAKEYLQHQYPKQDMSDLLEFKAELAA